MTQAVPSPPTGPIEAHAGAWLPWLEANQGLISLVALTVALVFAVLEYRRANRASDDRREEFRDALIGVCDEIEKDLTSWPESDVCLRADAVIEALLKAPPPAAKLISEAWAFHFATLRWSDQALMAIKGAGHAERPSREDIAHWRERLRKA